MNSIKIESKRFGGGTVLNETRTPWFVLKSPELGKPFYEFYKACREKSILDKKTKELLMLALASVSHCHVSMGEHIKAALEAGASKEEITEALLIAVIEGAGLQLVRDKEEIYAKYFP